MLKTGTRKPAPWWFYGFPIATGLAIFSWVQTAQSQETSAPSPEPSHDTQQVAPHLAKIWTNDDVVALRTPMDIYVLEKEARAAAEEAFAYQRLLACFAFDQPAGSREETELEIKSTNQAIDDSQEAVTQARLQLANSPETLRLRNQLELTRRTAELDELRAKLAALQKRLSELNATNTPKTSSEPQLPAAPIN
jgi:uncharacterized protein YicC (UPF0701 family)